MKWLVKKLEASLSESKPHGRNVYNCINLCVCHSNNGRHILGFYFVCFEIRDLLEKNWFHKLGSLLSEPWVTFRGHFNTEWVLKVLGFMLNALYPISHSALIREEDMIIIPISQKGKLMIREYLYSLQICSLHFSAPVYTLRVWPLRTSFPGLHGPLASCWVWKLEKIRGMKCERRKKNICSPG